MPYFAILHYRTSACHTQSKATVANVDNRQPSESTIDTTRSSIQETRSSIQETRSSLRIPDSNRSSAYSRRSSLTSTRTSASYSLSSRRPSSIMSDNDSIIFADCGLNVQSSTNGVSTRQSTSIMEDNSQITFNSEYIRKKIDRLTIWWKDYQRRVKTDPNSRACSDRD